jgi:hypothetical protein
MDEGAAVHCSRALQLRAGSKEQGVGILVPYTPLLWAGFIFSAGFIRAGGSTHARVSAPQTLPPESGTIRIRVIRGNPALSKVRRHALLYSLLRSIDNYSFRVKFLLSDCPVCGGQAAIGRRDRWLGDRLSRTCLWGGVLHSAWAGPARGEGRFSLVVPQYLARRVVACPRSLRRSDCPRGCARNAIRGKDNSGPCLPVVPDGALCAVVAVPLRAIRDWRPGRKHSPSSVLKTAAYWQLTNGL